MADLAQALTDEQMADLTVKLRDPEWRLSNLYYIKDKDGNTVLFKPNRAQRRFMARLWTRNIIPKARQRGFSTCVQLMMLDFCLFVPPYDAAIIAQDRETAARIRNSKIMFAYDRLPQVVKDMVPLKIQNITELRWENGSTMSISSSVRGGTPDFLHVSELGIVCLYDPIKAEEIQSGSLPAVPKTSFIVIESTVESPYGIFSDMVRTAMATEEEGRELNVLDYRLHFASWWDADEYEVDPTGVRLSPQDHAYFARLEGELDIEISLRKRAWYVTTLKNNFGGVDEKMWRQYPSTLEEAFTVAKGGIWIANEMALARKEQRFTNVPLQAGIPVNTFWDIGTNDATSIWLHQTVGPRDHFIGFIEGSSEPPSYYVREMQKAREERGFVWGAHYLPHDGAKRNPTANTLVTYQDMLLQLGLTDIVIVPRIDRFGMGVDLMREDFANYWIDADRCKQGIEHLDQFMKVYNKNMQLFTEQKAQNGHDHAADALRQKAQAKAEGLMRIPTNTTRKSKRKRASAMAS